MFNDENWQSFLKELVDAEAIDVSSLKLKNKLSEDFWENEKLKPEIADALYAIAKEFFQTLQLDPSVLLKDVTLTGSLATFNWSDMSDVDAAVAQDFATYSPESATVPGTSLQAGAQDASATPAEVAPESARERSTKSEDKWREVIRA